MITPNVDRVLIKKITITEAQQGNIIVPGQVVVGENLYAGEIVHPGTTKFKKGQLVYFSEYSASAITDIGTVVAGKETMSDVRQKGSQILVVAEDDIMAYEEE